MFTTTCIALGVFLTISVYVLIVRKLLIGDVDNDNYKGAIIPVLLILSLASLICSVIAVAGAVYLDVKPMFFDEIAQIKNHNIIALIVGYVSLSFNYIMLKIIEIKSKRNRKEQPKHESRWDLDKLNKRGFQ